MMSIENPEPTFVVKCKTPILLFIYFIHHKNLWHYPAHFTAWPSCIYEVYLCRAPSVTANTGRCVVGHSSCHGEVWHAPSRVTCHAGRGIDTRHNTSSGDSVLYAMNDSHLLTSPILCLQGVFLRIMVTMVAATHGMAAGTRRGQQRAGGRRANRITRYTIQGVTTQHTGLDTSLNI